MFTTNQKVSLHPYLGVKLSTIFINMKLVVVTILTLRDADMTTVKLHDPLSHTELRVYFVKHN